MKKSLKKAFSFLGIIILISVVGLILYSVTVYEKDYPDYSSYSAKKTGIKAVYMLADRCGFEVSRNHYPVKFLDEKAAMVAYRPSSMLLNEADEQKGLEDWLNKGNTLILIPDEETIGQLWIFNLISENQQWNEVVNIGNITVTWYGLKNGTVCVMDSANSFLNENLNGSDAAIAFIRVLDRINNQKVIFNEYYQFMQQPSPHIWDLIGLTGQLIVIQLLLVILLFVIKNWKPFGRVRGERELTKRPENEVVKALAGLYHRMKAYPVVLSNYYGYFTKEYRNFLKVSGRLQENAVRTLAECEFYMQRGKLSKNELRSVVQRLEKLEDKINNGNHPERKE